MTPEDAAPEDALRIRLTDDIKAPNVISSQDAVIKRGPRAWKTAQIVKYGNDETRDVSKTALILKSFAQKKNGLGYAFTEKPEARWYCDDDEITKLSQFLIHEISAAGEYSLIPETSVAATVAKLSQNAEAAASAVTELLQNPQVREALSRTGGLQAGAALVQRQERISGLQELEQAALAKEEPEKSFQKILEKCWWIFGSRYIDINLRRSLTVLDQFDLPLIRSDGSLHLVELKRADIPKLVIPYRNHFTVGPDVNTAVGQTMNYLKSLDEQAHQIKGDFDIDVHRIDATVVIGHSAHATEADSLKVAQAIRTYNSHLSRVNVVTYEDLINGAKAALKLPEQKQESASEPDPHWSPDGPGDPWNPFASDDDLGW